jgi:hypothetical protein
MAPAAAALFAADLARVARARRTALLVITADDRLARGLGGTRLTLEPSTGRWRSGGLWKRMTGALKPTARS